MAVSRWHIWPLVALVLAIGVARAKAPDWPRTLESFLAGKPAVRKAARARLAAALKTDEAETVAPLMGDTGHPDALALLLAALGEKPSAPVVRALGEFHGHAVRVVAAIRVQLPDASLETEREIVRALVRLRCPESRDWILKEVAGDGLGRVAAVFDVARRPDVLLALARTLPGSHPALVLLAKQDLGKDAAPWCAWIETLERNHGRPDGDRGTDRDLRTEGGAVDLGRFYGLPIPEGDFVFVIDSSGSMSHAREGRSLIHRVKVEVAEVIRELSEKQRFNVVFFGSRARSFRRTLQSATVANRRRAMGFLRKIAAGGGTNLEAGLHAALADPEVREIVLLSDGAPTEGRLLSADEVIRFLGRKKVRIHAVGTSAAASLLRELAKRTGGEFRILR